jgi:hypothetical protein
MQNDQKRPGGIKTPVRSLFQMLGHESGSNSSLPVQRLDKAMQSVGGKKTGGVQGIHISGNVGDINTQVVIPSVKTQAGNLKRQNAGPANPPMNKKKG